MSYNVTPCLKIAISWKPAASLQTCFPEATSKIQSKNLCAVSSISASSTRTPELKSIQFCFLLARGLLLEIFTVGTGEANGVPLPVVNKTMCDPLAAKAVDATKSFPGALRRLRPGV